MSTYFLLEKESRAKKTLFRRCTLRRGCSSTWCGAMAPLARVRFAFIVVPSLAGVSPQKTKIGAVSYCADPRDKVFLGMCLS